MMDSHTPTSLSTILSWANLMLGLLLLLTMASTSHVSATRASLVVRFLGRLLRFEALVGTGIVLCVGLMTVFAGTLPPVP